MITFTHTSRKLTCTQDGKPVAGIIGRLADEKSKQIITNSGKMNNPELKRVLQVRLANLRLMVSQIKPDTIADLRKINDLNVKIASVKSRIKMLNYHGDICDMPVYKILNTKN